MPDVKVIEVGLRDGLQMVRNVMPTEAKKQWIERAYAAGVREMQLGSFVPVARMPQFADTPALIAEAHRFEGLHGAVMVPNLKGAQAAIEAGADQLNVPLSASAAHSSANVRTTPDAMLELVASVCRLRDELPEHRRPKIKVGLATAFGCTLQGEVPESEVERLAIAVVAAGADSISLSDTTGYANPAQVRRLFRRVREAAGDRVDTAHFHDTRGLGLANVVAALDCGIRRFDASLAGLGGCPHAPGATGNIVTEDLVFMLESMGLSTGIDVAALVAMRPLLQHALPDEKLNGNLWKAGLTATYPHAGARIEEAAHV
ncbi:hydroxymethylglutaryl-CoA lyase [Variovorax sp. J31P207]|uniref:hydroxymethylglutaryl-CoA lyase n=1 Tax=Variovorax sp. J31P207 TaxID=3053510 RepID=UPI0025780799|nr:hydroxymethylglutaryl-CoA lyase [Variovorax sp. J31P207]MDM0072491.1 hydroxymethylglutaryl-CoA lyase [Variovorax sp. J31P207]